jgi:16S rRNA (guanine(966)-N(2))-methyltransferase RsmD
MRIVGGKYKGRVFSPDKKFGARPTTDLAKEALFNILANRYNFEGMQVLDLFSGTGSIGYEFISRETGSVIFVERNYQHAQFIKKIISQLEISNVQIILDDVFRFLKKCPSKFDIVFADPPFDLKQLNEIPQAVFMADILKNDGLFILEHPGEYDFSNHPNFTEIRKYGKVNFSFFTPPSKH